MKTKRGKLIVLAAVLCLLLSLCAMASAESSVTFSKNPYADEILVYGSVNALDDAAAAAYTNEYKGLQQTVITAEELLNKVTDGDEFAITFASKLGLGMNAKEIEINLRKMVDEYQEHIAKGETFTEPRFVINGVNIVLNKSIDQVRLTRNADGTYSASLNGDMNGYRGSIMIDADASITIMYDENGEAKIERRVSNGKPTDFVITLDVSGSMEYGGRDNAMFSALKTVLEEILQEEKNTVSIVFWAKDGAVMQLEVDQEGIKQVFTGADGMTVQKMFDANLVDRYNHISDYSLTDATISRIEYLYNLGSITEPDKGLYKALDLLENIERSEERNTGVMLFTDGTVVASGRSTETVERNTVALEKQIAENYGATLVNVSIGDEYDVQSYGRYLDPQSDTYYDQDQLMKDKVLYYNIPKLTDQELADRVSEMFEVAFVNITTETKELRTETITDGVLAAYGAQLIEKIPAGFELVEIKGETTNYEVRGTDENGNTMISFNLGEIVSGKDQVLSYCVIPTGADYDIGVTAFSDSTDTVLYARPVDRLIYLEEEQVISIRLGEDNLNQDLPQRSNIDGITKNHQHIFTDETIIKNIYSEYDETNHYISGEVIQLKCIVCGLSGNNTTRRLQFDQNTQLEEHQLRNGRCVRCGYVGEDSEVDIEQKRYYEKLLNYIKGNINPLNDKAIVETIEKQFKAGGLKEAEINTTIDILKKAPTKYRDLYLLSLFNYDLQINGSEGAFYSWPWNENAINMKPTNSDDFSHTFFHESGHAIELNIYWPQDGFATSIEESITDVEERIQSALFSDVETLIRTTVRTLYGDDLQQNDENAIVNALINANEQERGFLNYRKTDITIRDDKRLSDMYEKVRDEIESGLSTIPWNNGSMVADVVGGVTNNKIYVGIGHAKENYWYTNGEATYFQLFEAWAEFYSATIQQDTYNISKNAEYFPETTVLLDELADELYEYYIDYYTNVFKPYKHNPDGLKIAG